MAQPEAVELWDCEGGGVDAVGFRDAFRGFHSFTGGYSAEGVEQSWLKGTVLEAASGS
jgi:hypothetical protein